MMVFFRPVITILVHDHADQSFEAGKPERTELVWDCSTRYGDRGGGRETGNDTERQTLWLCHWSLDRRMSISCTCSLTPPSQQSSKSISTASLFPLETPPPPLDVSRLGNRLGSRGLEKG
jgi:hypothetical protein